MKKFRKLVAMFLVVLSIGALLPLNDVSAKSKKTTDTSKRKYDTYNGMGYIHSIDENRLNQSFRDIQVGKYFKFNVADLKDSTKKAKAEWEISDDKIASIKVKGNVCVVTGKKAGTAILTAKVGDKTYQAGIVVFKKGDKLYEWRKNAKGIKDNYSLMALYGERYEYETQFYEFKGKTYDLGKTISPEIDFINTRENLLNTGLFEEVDLKIVKTKVKGLSSKTHKEVTTTKYYCLNLGYAGAWENNYYNVGADLRLKTAGKIIYPFGVKPKKPFKSNGVTYDYIAESDGYYISCLTGAVYTEFSDKAYDSQYSSEIKAGTILPFHFRNKDAKIFATIKDLTITRKYYNEKGEEVKDGNGYEEVTKKYSKEYVGFVDGTKDQVSGQALSNPTYYTNYCMEVGIGGKTGYDAPNFSNDVVFYCGDASKSINPMFFTKIIRGSLIIKQKKVKEVEDKGICS